MTSVKHLSGYALAKRASRKKSSIISIVHIGIDNCDKLYYSFMAFSPNGSICSIEDAISFDKN